MRRSARAIRRQRGIGTTAKALRQRRANEVHCATPWHIRRQRCESHDERREERDDHKRVTSQLVRPCAGSQAPERTDRRDPSTGVGARARVDRHDRTPGATSQLVGQQAHSGIGGYDEALAASRIDGIGSDLEHRGERERAQARYRDWWDNIGRVRFSRASTRGA